MENNKPVKPQEIHFEDEHGNEWELIQKESGYDLRQVGIRKVPLASANPSPPSALKHIKLPVRYEEVMNDMRIVDADGNVIAELFVPSQFGHFIASLINKAGE